MARRACSGFSMWSAPSGSKSWAPTARIRARPPVAPVPAFGAARTPKGPPISSLPSARPAAIAPTARRMRIRGTSIQERKADPRAGSDSSIAPVCARWDTDRTRVARASRPTARSRTARMAWAEGNRSSARRAMDRRTTLSTPRGIPGRTARGGRGSVVRRIMAVATSFGPSKGGRPVSVSYITAPAE